MKKTLVGLIGLQLALLAMLLSAGFIRISPSAKPARVKKVELLTNVSAAPTAHPSVPKPSAASESRIVEVKRNATDSFQKSLRDLRYDDINNDSMIIKLFLESYLTYCEAVFSLEEDQSWCPCLPASFVGRQNLSQILPPNPDIKRIESTHPEVTLGGHWKPQNCRPRQNAAIIIPYRNRSLHLHLFLYYMIPFLQRQMIEFTIFVVEQGKPEVFNKASIMNAGFLEVSQNGTFDCYIFHDVDTLPEDDRNVYTCTENPHHLVWYTQRHNYQPYSGAFVGGGNAFTAEQFRRMNGFSNRYYGWGGEDDDAYFRIMHSGMPILRYPRAVARYTTLDHGRDPGNPVNPKRVRFLGETIRDKSQNSTAKDGLNRIVYNVTRTEKNPLYSWISVDLPPPTEYRFPKRKPKHTG